MPRVPSAPQMPTSENSLVDFLEENKKLSTLFSLGEVIQVLKARSILPYKPLLKNTCDQIFFNHFIELILAIRWADSLKLANLAADLRDYVKDSEIIQRTQEEKRNLFRLALLEFNDSIIVANPEISAFFKEDILQQFKETNQCYRKFEEFITSSENKNIPAILKILQDCYGALKETTKRLDQLTPKILKSNLKPSHPAISEWTPKTPPARDGKKALTTEEVVKTEDRGSLTPSHHDLDEALTALTALTAMAGGSPVITPNGRRRKTGSFRQSSSGSIKPIGLYQADSQEKSHKEQLEEELEKALTKASQFENEREDALMAKHESEKSLKRIESEKAALQRKVSDLNEDVAQHEEGRASLNEKVSILEKSNAIEARKRCESDKALQRIREAQDKQYNELIGSNQRLQKVNSGLKVVNKEQGIAIKEHAQSLDEKDKETNEWISSLEKFISKLEGPISTSEKEQGARMNNLILQLQGTVEQKSQLKSENDDLRRGSVDQQKLFDNTQDLTQRLKNSLAVIQTISNQQALDTGEDIDNGSQTRVEYARVQKLAQLAQEVSRLSHSVEEFFQKIEELQRRQSIIESTQSAQSAPRHERYTSPAPARKFSRPSLEGTPTPLRLSSSAGFPSSSSLVSSPTLSSFNSFSSYETDITIPDFGKGKETIQDQFRQLKQQCLDFSNQFVLQEGENAVINAEYQCLIGVMHRLENNISQLDEGFRQFEQVYIIKALKKWIKDVGNHAHQFLTLRRAQEVFNSLILQCEPYLSPEADKVPSNTRELRELRKAITNTENRLTVSSDQSVRNIPDIAVPWLKIKADFEGSVYQKLDIFRELNTFEWGKNKLEVCHSSSIEGKEQAILKLYRERANSRTKNTNSLKQLEVDLEETILSLAHILVATIEKNPGVTLTLEGENSAITQLIDYLATENFYRKKDRKLYFVVKTPHQTCLPSHTEEQLKDIYGKFFRGIPVSTSENASCTARTLEAELQDYRVPSPAHSMVSAS